MIGQEAIAAARARRASTPTWSSVASAAARTSPGSPTRSSAGELREGRDPVRRRRAGRLPDADPRRLPLRLRRHGRAHPADADVHAGPRLRPAAGARRAACATTATRRASARWSRRGWSRRGAISQTARLRRRASVRARRGDHPRARALARAAGVVRRGGGRQAGRRGAGDPGQPLRPRPLRHVRLRRLPCAASSPTSSSARGTWRPRSSDCRTRPRWPSARELPTRRTRSRGARPPDTNRHSSTGGGPLWSAASER